MAQNDRHTSQNATCVQLKDVIIQAILIDINLQRMLGMKKIHLAICDDEDIDLSQALELVGEYDREDNLQISVFHSAAELFERCNAFDIILLDIEMEPPNGFETAKRLTALPDPPVIIFITKSSAYALKGYGIALRYIQKHIEKSILFEALDAAIGEAAARRMTFKVGDTTYTIRLAELLYIEVLGHYATVHTLNGQYRFRSTLRDIMGSLPKLYFASPHKSYVVNFEKIQSATSDELHLCDGTRIPISRGKSNDFNKAFYRFLGR